MIDIKGLSGVDQKEAEEGILRARQRDRQRHPVLLPLRDHSGRASWRTVCRRASAGQRWKR